MEGLRRGEERDVTGSADEIDSADTSMSSSESGVGDAALGQGQPSDPAISDRASQERWARVSQAMLEDPRFLLE